MIPYKWLYDGDIIDTDYESNMISNAIIYGGCTDDKQCAGSIGDILSINLDKICVRVTASTLMEELYGK